MSRRGAAIIVSAALAAGLLGYSGYRALVYVHARPFSERLHRVDILLADGKPERAYRLVVNASSKADTAADWLALCKRGYLVSQATGGFTPLLETVERAIDVLPGRPDLHGIKGYAELRSGKPSSALVSARLAGDDPRFASIAEEAEARLLEKIIRNGSAVVQGTGSVSEDPRLKVNIVLELARNGRYDRAESLYSTHQEPSPDLGFWLSLYAGHPLAAAVLMTRHPGGVKSHGVAEPSEILAEALFRGGKTAEALRLLADRDDGGSAAVLLNRAFLFMQEGYRPAALAELERGAEDPRISSDVLPFLAGAYIDSGAEEKGRALLNEIHDTELSGVVRILSDRRIKPFRSTLSMLWELYGKTGGGSAARLIAYYSYAVGDPDSLGMLLSRTSDDFGSEAWHTFYRGVSALYSGDAAEAERQFNAVAPVPWEALYNAAVARSLMRDYGEALEYLRSAEEIMGYNDKASEMLPFRAEIRISTALILLARGDRDGARRQAEYALDLDPGNHRGREILGELEAVSD